MIDLDYAVEQFRRYRNKYPAMPEIDLKAEHMIRVMNNSIFIATSLGLTKEEVALAGIIGLLHDIGRFEQQRSFHTFVDKDSIDHAIFSSQLLFEGNLLHFFLEDSAYYVIISDAILNHNRYALEDGLDKHTLLQAKILRDADKLDIYPQVLASDAHMVFDGAYPTSEDVVQDAVLASFIKEECVKTEDMRTKLDDFVRKCALVYGFYYPEISLKTIYREEYLYRLRVQFMEAFPAINPLAMEQFLAVEFATNAYIYKKVNKRK